MRTQTIIILVGIVFLLASCHQENNPQKDKCPSSIEVFDPSGLRQGGGDDDDEQIILWPTVVNQQGEVISGAEIHLYNDDYYTWGTIDPVNVLQLKAPEMGLYDYTIYINGEAEVFTMIELDHDTIYHEDTL